jgi:hypothetical protein
MKVNQSAEFKISTNASPNELFAGEQPLIDYLAQGVKVDIKIDLWKDFFTA